MQIDADITPEQKSQFSKSKYIDTSAARELERGETRNENMVVLAHRSVKMYKLLKDRSDGSKEIE